MLKDKVAIVTGGTRGIGFAIAKRLIQEGADVALFGQNQARGEEAAEQLSKDGQRVKFYAVDVADGSAVDLAISKVSEELGPIDILVNNAGITRDGLLMKMKEEDWVAVMDTNLKSAFHTCKSVVRPMMNPRSGKIINITSVVGLIGNPGQTNYAASKSGLIGFTQSLARELASRGITANCIAPGFIQTDMTDALSDAQKEALMKQIPMGRLGQPEDIANAVAFLASDNSAYITGQTLTVDGGMVM
ncbi:MAG: 3-oxoacyl-[acyl-carrier-protein] reductase FabG [Chlamydiales bacterium]|nr:3-oxoacyl-[acyl-carrier-protein] reductase FabG [Chlamydiales bacterium]